MKSRIKTAAIVLSIVIVLVIAVYVVFFRAMSSDVTPPQWRNQRQSQDRILPGSYVGLEAEGIDAVSLHLAVLSTNETGAWKNMTEHALLWMQNAVYGFDNFGTATYKDGVLYAPSKGDNNVYAINASDGAVLWTREVRQCDASPCIDGNVIFVGECSGPLGENTSFPKAMALDRTTGQVIWQYIEPGNYAWVGSPVVDGDYVYYTTLGAGVYALNKTDGNPLWNARIGKIVCSVACDNGVLFVSTNDPPGQYALNAATGAEMWHKNYGASWDSSPVIQDDVIIQVTYTDTGSAKVWATNVLNETNGELVRRFMGKGACSTPLVDNGNIFIPNGDDWKIYAYDIASGNELWHSVDLHDGTKQDQSYCSPATSGGAIYYQSLNGTFYVLNQSDGKVLWSYSMGKWGFGSISLGDGCAYVTNDYALYAFRIGPGTGDWPMFCQNNLHRSRSENGVQYIRDLFTEPKTFVNSANVWIAARFMWRNSVAASEAIAWRIYFYDEAGNVNATDVMVFYVDTSR